MTPNQAPTTEQLDNHDEAIETLTGWADEDLSAEDRQALDELADEAKQAREEDGTLAFRAEQMAEAAKQAEADDAKAHEGATWRDGNPDSRTE